MSSLARPRAILKWLARATSRHRRTFRITGNNLNYTAVALAFMLDAPAAGRLGLVERAVGGFERI